MAKEIGNIYLYNYGNQFWGKYKNNRRYLHIVSNDAHKNVLELVKYMDDTIYNFLMDLFNDNLLINTTIILISDHGEFRIMEQDYPRFIIYLIFIVWNKYCLCSL